MRRLLVCISLVLIFASVGFCAEKEEPIPLDEQYQKTLDVNNMLYKQAKGEKISWGEKGISFFLKNLANHYCEKVVTDNGNLTFDQKKAILDIEEEPDSDVSLKDWFFAFTVEPERRDELKVFIREIDINKGPEYKYLSFAFKMYSDDYTRDQFVPFAEKAFFDMTFFNKMCKNSRLPALLFSAKKLVMLKIELQKHPKLLFKKPVDNEVTQVSAPEPEDVDDF